MKTRQEWAAFNNASWCHGMCVSHCVTSEIRETMWVCEGRPPRFHSNGVTLKPGESPIQEYHRLRDSQPSKPWGIKDSFACLNLTQDGLGPLFDATWIWHGPVNETKTSLDWRRLSTDAELLEWEGGWAFADEEAANYPRQFPPSLLSNSANAFMGGYQDEVLLSGCILNLTGEVVGLSNTFSTTGQNALGWNDFASVTGLVFPSAPIVGYERGEDLELALSNSFEKVGELRVWIHY